VVSRLVYGKNHPYGEIETAETVKKVTVDDIRKYYTTYWKPNISYLIFVGDITVDEAKKLAEANFSSWQKGEVPVVSYPMPEPPAKTYIAVVDRPSSVQSVINLVTPIQLKPGQPDVIPSTVMNSILGNGSSGRLYKNLREKHGFTYGAYSQISSDRLVGNFTASASVRNEKTDSAIGQFLVELNRIRDEKVADADLNQTKNEMSGSFARALESPATIANFALNVARYHLPKDYYQNYLKTLAMVDNAAVEKMADKYVTPGHMHIVIVGNAKQIAKGLEKYGEVKYFDVYGNEKAAETEKKVDPSVTAMTVIDKAISAQGTDASMAAIKDLTMKGTANVMGNKLDFLLQYILPSAYMQHVSMGPNSLGKQIVNNGTYKVLQQGMEQPVEEKDKEEMNEDAALFREVYFKKTGYKFDIKGIESINGKDAYNIEISSPEGRVMNYFYDVSSGLRVKETKTSEGPQGKTTIQVYYNEYKEVNGVKVPVKMLLDVGVYKMDIDISDVTANQGLKAEDLK
jgi:hypothetical protein